MKARYLRIGTQLIVLADPYERTIRAVSCAGERLFTERERFEDPSVPWLAFEASEVFAAIDIPPA